MEEFELNKLPEEEQVSDDFELFTDGKYFYAIRNRFGPSTVSFCLEAKSKWSAISLGVDAIHSAIINRFDPVSIPLELALFYIEPEGNS